MLSSLLLVGFFSPLSIHAFSDRYPVVGWSSLPSSLLDLSQTVSPFSGHDTVLDALLNIDELCQYDVVIVASQPGLHANDLRNLPRSSRIASALHSSPCSLQLPYVTHNSEAPLSEVFPKTLSKQCGHRVVHSAVEFDNSRATHNVKHVVSLPPQDAFHENGGPHGSLHKLDQHLPSQLDRLTQGSQSHLVLLIGSPPSRNHPYRRQATTPLLSTQQQSPNSTLATGGILKRYQLLTPALISAFLIVLLVYFPLLFVGINALASIQSPRISGGARTVTAERKNQ